MEQFGFGAGLASIAFWGFLATAVVAGVWDNIRKRDAQHETVRRMIESGQKLDQDLLDKLMSISSGERRRLDRDIKVAALYVLPVAAGLAVFGLVLGSMYPTARIPLLGVAAMLACIGAGFLVAARVLARWYEDENSSLNQL
jgi:nitrate/nitrite transporter NarK